MAGFKVSNPINDYKTGIQRDLVQLQRATLDELAVQMRKALRGKGYHSRLPPTRTTRAGRAARKRTSAEGKSIGEEGGKPRKASRTQWRVKPQKARKKMNLQVRCMDYVGALNERSPSIRGYRNRWYEAGLKTINENWDAMSTIAQQRAPERVRSNEIRRIKTRQAKGLS